MIRHTSQPRRTVLSGIVTGAVVAVSGCLSGGENDDPESETTNPGGDGVFTNIFVDGTELVLEFTDEASIDQVNVIDPDGELFTERSISTGVGRETIEIGTGYQPGEYTVIALENDTEQTTQSILIEPDVQITDLRLGRNHPDEMFEGASERQIRTEAIVTLKNSGTGPDEAIALSFAGDIPGPTSDLLDESGIYDTESDIRRHSDAVLLPPKEEVVIYSYSSPFTSASENVSCSPETEYGEFEVIVETTLQDEPLSTTYKVLYTGENLLECDIEIRGEQ